MGKSKKKKKYVEVMTFETPDNMDGFFENFIEALTTEMRKTLFVEVGPREGYSTVIEVLTAGMESYFHVIFETPGSHTVVSFSTDVKKEGMMKMMIGMKAAVKLMIKPQIKGSVIEALRK